MSRTNHFAMFLTKTCEEQGITPYEAAQLPGAKAASLKDKEAAKAFWSNMSTTDHIEQFLRNRAADGLPPHFIDQEEMLLAMKDEKYETSEEYRQAVASIIAQTPGELLGVSASFKGADGQRVHIGRQPEDGKATVESMLRNARRDALMETMKNMDLNTAVGRYEYMKFLADPANAEAVQEMTDLVVSPEQQTRWAMLERQAAGNPDRIQLKGTIAGPDGPIDLDAEDNSNGSAEGEGKL